MRKLTGAVVFIATALVLSGAFAGSPRASASGRALTPAEMAAVFGDAGPKCKKNVSCKDSYPNTDGTKTYCQYCDFPPNYSETVDRCCDSKNPASDCNPNGAGNNGCEGGNVYRYPTYDPSNVGTCGLCAGSGTAEKQSFTCKMAQASGNGKCDP